MIATIAVIAAIDKKKKVSDRSDHSNHMKTTFQDRSDNSLAIAGKWFPYDRYDRCDRWEKKFSDRSDHSDHMGTRLKLCTFNK